MDKMKAYFLIEPKKMQESERIDLAKRVYEEAHTRVFSGTTFEDFYHTVFTPETLVTKIAIYTNGLKVQGYVSFQVYEVSTTKNENTHIIMSEMGISESGHSQKRRPIFFIYQEAVKHRIKNICKKIFVVDTLISSHIYKRCCEVTHEIYPKKDEYLPVKYEQLILNVGRNFKWQLHSTANAFVRTLKWRAMDHNNSNRNINYKEVVDYYNRTIPDLQEGRGLITVIPITQKNLFLSGLKMMRLLFNRKKQDYMAKLHSFPFRSIVLKTSHK